VVLDGRGSRKVCNELGIRNINLGTFKYTYVSHLIMAGVVDLPTVAKILGHTDIKTTMIYSRLAVGRIILGRR